MRTFQNIAYGEACPDKQKLDIYLPNDDAFSVLLYFHGGGLKGGDKASASVAPFCQYLADNGIAVVSANYRMYPDAKYPDFLEDAAEATGWVFRNMRNYGQIQGIYVGGSSAGGYISQMLCFDKRWLGKQGLSAMDISGFIHDAGQPTCHFNVLRERGFDTKRVIIDESAPLYHVGEDEQYPKMLIIVSDDDMKNRYEQTKLLVSTLEHFGHKENVQLIEAKGKHCAYIGQFIDGFNVLGRWIQAFMSAVTL